MEKFLLQLRENLTQEAAKPSKLKEKLLAAAILVLFVQINGEWNILFTRRTNGVRTHQGEVSFPGGAYENEDISLLQTALREADEEIGIDSGDVEILGGLEPIQTITQYFVYPYIGILKWPVDFTVNDDEVERVFMIPVDWLMDETNYYEKSHTLNGNVFRQVIHYKDYDGEHLWGFTARVTQQILKLIS